MIIHITIELEDVHKVRLKNKMFEIEGDDIDVYKRVPTAYIYRFNGI